MAGHGHPGSTAEDTLEGSLDAIRKTGAVLAGELEVLQQLA